MSFEAKQWKAVNRVRFLTRGPNYAFFLTPTEAVLSWNREESRFRSGHRSMAPAALRLRLIGANRQPRLSGLDPLPGKSHYFVGNNPNRWKTQIETYSRVKYEEVYPGIDMIFYGHGQRFEYDFRLAPGADPKAIGLRFDGASKLRLDESGDLVLETAAGNVRQHRPVV